MSCEGCKKRLATTSPRITCGACTKTYHKQCSNVQDKDWENFDKGLYLFNCAKCKSNRRRSVTGGNLDTSTNQGGDNGLLGVKESISKLQTDIASVFSTNKEVEKSLTHLDEVVTGLESTIAEWEKKLKKVDELEEENVRLKNKMNSLEKRLERLEG